MEPIRICEIVTAVGGALWKGNPNAEVTSVSTNSRELEPGGFVCADCWRKGGRASLYSHGAGYRSGSLLYPAGTGGGALSI